MITNNFMRSFHDPNTVSAIFQFLVTHELCILGRSCDPLGPQFTHLGSQNPKLSHLSRGNSLKGRGVKGA